MHRCLRKQRAYIFKQYIVISSRKRDAIDVIYFENFSALDHRFALSQIPTGILLAFSRG